MNGCDGRRVLGKTTGWLLLACFGASAACSGKYVSQQGAGGAAGTGGSHSSGPGDTDQIPAFAGASPMGAPGGAFSTGGTFTIGYAGAMGKGGGPAAGAGGAGGAVGLQMVDGKCPPNSIKHDDLLCYCQPTTLSACADGCGDFNTDPNHCGNCSTKCGPLQACIHGACGAAPALVADAGAGCGSLQLAQAGDRVYFTDKLHGKVSSSSVNGTGQLEHANWQMQPTHLEVNGTMLFWLAAGSRTILSVSIGGGSVETIAGADTNIGGFTLSTDGKMLYYGVDKRVFGITAAPGNAPFEVGHDVSGVPQGMAFENNRLLMTTDVNGDVESMAIVPGDVASCAPMDVGLPIHNCTRPARSQGSLLFDHVVLLGGQAYWVNGVSINTDSASNPGGFNFQVVQTPSPTANTITAFALDGSGTFFADDAGNVYRAPPGINAEATPLARGQEAVTSMVSDGKRLFWASRCSIVSAPLQ